MTTLSPPNIIISMILAVVAMFGTATIFFVISRKSDPKGIFIAFGIGAVILGLISVIVLIREILKRRRIVRPPHVEEL